MLDQSTICAISTSPGVGAIAIIRLSGGESITLTDKVFRSPNKGKLLVNQPANTMHFGRIIYNEEVIDEVIVSLFRAPHSFTGEDSVEISCHGSTFIQQRILEILVECGARLARRGTRPRSGRCRPDLVVCRVSRDGSTRLTA